MTQVNNIVLMAQAIGADIGLINGKLGDLTSLTTTDKTNLVGALNELKALLDGAGVGVQIDDVTPSTSTVYSSTKTESVATDKANTAAAALINDTTPSTSKVYSSTKVNSAISAATSAMIDDVTASTTKTYSSSKVNAQIDAAIAAIIDGAPGTFDTLKEIADYIASDTTGMAALTTAVNNRVRYDAAQVLTVPQQIQASTNIGVGDITTDFVAAYNTAKA